MNILFVFHTPFIPINGGVERVTDLLAKELIKRGENVFYLSLYKKISNFEYPVVQEYFPCDKMNKSNIEFYNNYLVRNKIDIVINQNGAEKYSNLFLNINTPNVTVISVVHTFPLLGYFYHKYSLEPHWISFSLKDCFDFFAKLLLFYFRLIVRKNMQLYRLKKQYKLLSEKSDRIILLSQSYKKYFLWLCPNSEIKIESIPNPISEIENNKLKLKEKEILFVGRFDFTTKRPDRLIKIWQLLYQKHPDWKLIMVGYGKAEKYMKAYSQRHNINNIVWAGQCNPQKYYDSASILCLTSSYEGFPMVLLEAMSNSVVPVAFDSFSSVNDLIKHNENGGLITPFNYHEYANYLSKLMDDEEYLKMLALKSFEKSKAYSINSIIKLWYNLFNKL